MKTLVRVGTKHRFATPEDIQDIKTMVLAAKKDPQIKIVTHHAVKFIPITPLEGETVVFHVGSEEIPATEDDIIDLQSELAEAAAEDRPIVTHHLVRVTYAHL